MHCGQRVLTAREPATRTLVAGWLALAFGCGQESKAPVPDGAGVGGVDVGEVDMVEIAIDAHGADDSAAGSTDAGVVQGAAGAPCKAATDCDSALCLQTLDGGRCSTYCGDGECQPGWSCQGLSGGGDGTYFCIPDAGLLCRPCESHELCRASGIATAACVDYGDLGAFCGLPCQSDASCPAGSACRDAKGIDGGPVKQCVQPGAGPGGLGICACPPVSKVEAHGTGCWLVDGDGAAKRRCKGKRVCGPAGLGTCTALTGAEAQCFDLQCLDALTGLPLADGKGCDDGRACTVGDVCKAGLCQSGTQTCACEPGHKACQVVEGDAKNLCRGEAYCAPTPGLALPFACLPNPGQTKVCDVSLDSACEKNACLPLSGACTPTAVERTVELCDLPAVDGKAGCRREVKAAAAPDGEAVACDDGLACSVGEVCAKGACGGAVLAACQCQGEADCPDDGDLCNGKPYCDTSGLSWSCKVNPATLISCDTSGDAGCLQTACVPKTGLCVKDVIAAGTACSDGVACTVGDVCDSAGKCQAGTWTCCKVDADCAKDEDGDHCNGTLFCNVAAGACQLNPATVVTCPSVDDTACAKAACTPKTGLCALLPLADKLACDDGDVCSDGDACFGGICQGGTETCGCATDADCAAKDDGDKCNGALYCNKVIGKCKVNPATVVGCPTVEDTACRRSQCQKQTGACAMVDLPAAVTCDADGTGCTQNDACDGAGACVAGTAVCVCQVDGDCAVFEDGDGCNGTLYCDKSGSQPACKLNPKTVKSCPSVDDTACLRNLCQPKSGLCAMTAVAAGGACSDGDSCTGGDGCDGKGGCAAGAAVLCGCKGDADCVGFDDGDVCNGAYGCKAGACVFGGAALDCDDQNACTMDACDKGKGCGHVAISGCVTCVTDEACEDGNGCTVDACFAPVCKSVNNDTLLCSDGDACSVGDACKSGVCKAQGPKVCDDKSPCTDDSCDVKTGCVFAANSKPCDADGSVCTEGDGCGGGVCKAGNKVVCSDGNPCTVDGCDAKAGCAFVASDDGAACDDGDACTAGDDCKASKCGGVGVSCNDGKACTDDSCDVKLGCAHKANVNACNDGDACTTGEVCKDGACAKGQTAVVCDDKNECTADSCDGAKGCVHDAAKAEGQTCAGVADGVCAGGVCKPGCSPGYEVAEVDDDGVKKKACAALGPVWGQRPDKPEGVYTVQDVGGEKVVKDSQTKLMWQQASAPQGKVWLEAVSYCEGLVFAGYKDWRLPSVFELESLVDWSVASPGPTIDAISFPGTKQAAYWTASVRAGVSTNAWSVDFSSGSVTSSDKTDPDEVRCVR